MRKNTRSPSQIAALALRVIVALAFIAAGGTKLVGVAPMVDLFNQIGVGQWLRFITAGAEIGGAVLLLIPGRTAYGAALLSCTMVGALATHLLLIGGNAIPAAILLALNLVILWLHRSQITLDQEG